MTSLPLSEGRKLGAFFRRDLLVAWSYRVAFFTDLAGLLVQAVLFYVVSLMVDPSKIPTFGGARASYMAFVAVGIAVSSFVELGLGRLAFSIRNEQLMGTLETVLLTPTSPVTMQIGSVLYDLAYVPVRIAVFLVLVAWVFGVRFAPGGIVPTAAVLVCFMPFVLGLGIGGAGLVLTFRRTAVVLGFVGSALALASGAYVPLSLLPAWVGTLARYNPIAIALAASREALLGGAAWAVIVPYLVRLAPISLLVLALGLATFHVALRRERRLGTLGLY